MAGSWVGGGWSLQAQSLYGSQPRGARFWVGAEEQPGQRRRAEGEEDRVRRDLRLHPGDLELATEHADGDAGQAADQGDQHGLRQELRENVRAPGPDRLADPDLACAL